MLGAFSSTQMLTNLICDCRLNCVNVQNSRVVEVVKIWVETYPVTKGFFNLLGNGVALFFNVSNYTLL